MLRAEIHQLKGGPLLKLEGRLVGEAAEVARALVTKTMVPVPTRLLIDLTDVTYIDSIGEQLLTWLKDIGAAFIASGIYVMGVCERLHLPLRRRAGRLF